MLQGFSYVHNHVLSFSFVDPDFQSGIEALSPTISPACIDPTTIFVLYSSLRTAFCVHELRV